MSLKSVYTKLEKIAQTDSTNEKIELLKVYLENSLFRRVCWCAYSEALQFKIKKFPAYGARKATLLEQKGNKEIFRVLKKLSNQPGASDQDKQQLFAAASEDEETFEIVKRICNKDLRAGFSKKTLNNARPGTIKSTPYQRCKTSKYIDNIIYDPEALAQTKADGTFVYCHVSEMSIKFTTRSGNTVKQLSVLKENMLEQPAKIKFGHKRGVYHNKDVAGFVYHGELRVWEVPGKKVMSRKKGNGIINSCIQGTADPEDAAKVFFTVWDCVTNDEFANEFSDVHYNTRYFYARRLAHIVGDERYVQNINSKRIKSVEEAYAFYKEQRAAGEEGAIIKNLSAIWKDQSSGSPDMIKLKHAFECELRVVKFEKGKKGKRNENRLGALICESECGGLEARVGYGFSDDERDWDEDMWLDEIISVDAEQVITSKNKDKPSLYSASYIEIRQDKTTANTLAEILEIEEESKRSKRRK